MSEVVAIACSDIHLSHNAPVARSAESDWYAAMANSLIELSDLAAEYECPVICGGDVFHKWNSPAELINFAIEELPKLYAVAGQHDLPHHSLEEVRRSAFYSAQLAATIKSLNSRPIRPVHNDFTLYGCAWEAEIPVPVKEEGKLSILVAHQYVYEDRSTCYGTAPKEAKVSRLEDQLKGYDVAIFGDNHTGFITKVGDCNVINCGSLMCRHADQRDYKPMVGLIYDDGHIEPHYMDISEDKWSVEAVEDVEEVENPELANLLEELRGLDVVDLDFRTAIRRHVNDEKVKPAVAKLLLEAIGD